MMLSTKPLPASTNTERNEQLLQSALFLARNGFHVFPVYSKKEDGSCSCNNNSCKSIGKHPRTQNGLKDATINPAVIQSWWSASCEGSNIAIATGAISGFFVVDVDVKHDGLRAWETYKDDHHFDDYETVAQQTPSGGKHVFYKMPAEGKVVTKTNVLANGIDIRGDGGYIVAAPSAGYKYVDDQALGNCPINEAPEVLINQVIKAMTKPTVDNASPLPPLCLYGLGKDENNKIKDALQHVDPDDYSVWWSIGAALHSTNGTEAFEWWCAWAQQSEKFDHNEHVAKWRDFDLRRGNTESVIFIDYLYKLAEGKGWVETFDHSDCFFDPNITNEEFQLMSKNLTAKPLAHSKIILAVRTISASLIPSAIPKRNWLIADYILKGYINLLVSPGAVGKSMFTLTEAISVATGRNLLNLGKVKQGNVLVINNEDDDDEINRRIVAICDFYHIPLNELRDKLFVRSGYSERITIAKEINGTVEPSFFAQEIINCIADKNIGLLTLDPFVSTHQSNENDNSNIDAVITCYKTIAGYTGVAIRIVHHTRKSGGGESDSHAGDVESARGASSLKDAARVCHTLSGMGEKAAKNSGVEPAERNRLVRIDDAKTNFSLSSGIAKWFYKQSVQIANGEWLGVMRPYNLEVTDKAEKPTRESNKAKVIHGIGHASLIKLGKEGGNIKATELRAEYINLVNCGKTTANDNFSLLPLGSSKSERINLHGNYFRIFQTKGERSTSPRYIHLQPDE